MRPQDEDNPDKDELDDAVFEGITGGVLVGEVADVGRFGVEVEHINLVDHEAHRHTEADQIPVVALGDGDDDREEDDGARGFAFADELRDRKSVV